MFISPKISVKLLSALIKRHGQWGFWEAIGINPECNETTFWESEEGVLPPHVAVLIELKYIRGIDIGSVTTRHALANLYTANLQQIKNITAGN